MNVLLGTTTPPLKNILYKMLRTAFLLKSLPRPRSRQLRWTEEWYRLFSTAGMSRLCSLLALACSSPKINASISLLYEWSAETTGSAAEPVAATVPITFVEPDGTEKAVDAIIGMHLLDVAHKNNIDLEGACGGELACSTCHLIFEKEVFDKLPAKLDDEDDMLDMALGLTAT
jgi:ferredoxin